MYGTFGWVTRPAQRQRRRSLQLGRRQKGAGPRASSREGRLASIHGSRLMALATTAWRNAGYAARDILLVCTLLAWGSSVATIAAQWMEVI